MTNLMANWWRSRQFRRALQAGDRPQAIKLLQAIQNSGAKLSVLEQQFKETLKFRHLIRQKNQEIKDFKEKYYQATQDIQKLDQLINLFPAENLLLSPQSDFIEFVHSSFQMTEYDQNMIQCRGIDSEIFPQFEAQVAEFIQSEFNHLSQQKNFASSLQKAIDDLNRLKTGLDPEYKHKLSPHVYFLRYFIENVYSAYFAWFFLYQSQLLFNKINILDIAAGPGTMIFGLALLLESLQKFGDLPASHISYYSLEQQKGFQYHGLQFWRKYLDAQQHQPTNAYFRFETSNIFDPDKLTKNIPNEFFDFVVISHCFFAQRELRNQSKVIYSQIFQRSLKDNGYVLLIIQEKKLFMQYGVRQSNDKAVEEMIVKSFVEELGLKLIWYKYLSSRPTRSPISSEKFSKFAAKNLACQTSINPLLKHYLQFKFDSHYKLDDYVILAQR